jgi:hypothetical protein
MATAAAVAITAIAAVIGAAGGRRLAGALESDQRGPATATPARRTIAPLAR